MDGKDDFTLRTSICQDRSAEHAPQCAAAGAEAETDENSGNPCLDAPMKDQRDQEQYGEIEDAGEASPHETPGLCLFSGQEASEQTGKDIDDVDSYVDLVFGKLHLIKQKGQEQ